MKTRIFLAGHHGMVGSAIMRKLQLCEDVIPVTRPKNELDLLNQAAVDQFFQETQIDEVYLAAARVGGIHANNSLPADFIYENLTIQSNVISSAFRAGIRKLLFLGSSCIYPRETAQPIKEEQLLTGKLELTNEPYAIAKIAGIKLCESFNRQHGLDYRSVMPTNLYGINDNFNPLNSHVIPAMINKFHAAKVRRLAKVECWGSGLPKREFLHVDDLADACVHVMNISENRLNSVISPMQSHINVGTEDEYSISELAILIAEVVGFYGEIEWDTSKPDGTMRKLLDSSKLKDLGWTSTIPLKQGLASTYDWYLKNIEYLRF